MKISSRLLFCSAVLCLTLAQIQAQKKEFIILHSNDTHSQIEPNAATAKSFANCGGAARRAAIIAKERKENKNVLVLDAGDFVQGTPYFNFFKGEIEVKLMNEMGYIASTFGNHEFDNGIQALADVLALAKFQMVSTNYDVTGTALEPYTKKYMIYEQDGVKFGILGVTCNPDQMIAKKNYEGIRYIDPVEAVNEYTPKLKEMGCDVIILLSHEGYNKSDKRGDRRIAKASKDLDIIIGGHSHTSLKNGEQVLNREGKPVKIVQTGGRGFTLGKVTLIVDKEK